MHLAGRLLRWRPSADAALNQQICSSTHELCCICSREGQAATAPGASWKLQITSSEFPSATAKRRATLPGCTHLLEFGGRQLGVDHGCLLKGRQVQLRRGGVAATAAAGRRRTIIVRLGCRSEAQEGICRQILE